MGRALVSAERLLAAGSRPLARLGLALAVAFASAHTAAHAEEAAGSGLGVTGEADESAPVPVPPDEPSRTVELDRLLQLPSSLEFQRQKRNGVSSDVWHARFRDSFDEILEIEQAIEATKQELDEMAGTGGGSQWQMAPPGSSNTEVTPLSFKLREQLREQREQLEEARQRHRDLVIQADLADVPEEWRRTD